MIPSIFYNFDNFPFPFPDIDRPWQDFDDSDEGFD